MTKQTDSSHEKWFENDYLKPRGLHNKKIQSNDFEGIICDNISKQELAIFELKSVTLENIRNRVSEEFASADCSHGLILYPQQDEMRSRLRDIISKARDQVLKKSLCLPRIIFLVIDNRDIRTDTGVTIPSIIKGKQVIVFPEGTVTSESAISGNEEATDLFYADNLSGIICIYRGTVEHRGVFVIKNSKAKNRIPEKFLIKVPRGKPRGIVGTRFARPSRGRAARY